MIKDSNAYQLIKIYNELDAYMRKNFNDDRWISHPRLIEKMADKNPLFEKYERELKEFADLRNSIVHNPYIEHADPIAEPHNYVIELYDSIRKEVLEPKTAYSISVKLKDMYYINSNDTVMSVIKMMKRNKFNYAPIIDHNKLLGVFSENTILSFMADGNCSIADNQAKVKEIIAYTDIQHHDNEYFLFIDKKTTVVEVEALFKKDRHNKVKRLGALFISDNGRVDGNILGMLTAWDIAGL